MIFKIVNSLIIGLALVLMLDFLFFIGIKINYFDLYGIKEYYNVIFFDNQNFTAIILLSLVFGYLMLYSSVKKLFDTVYIALVLVFLSTLYEPVGKGVAKVIFTKKEMTFKLGSTTFTGDMLYEGREYIYIKRASIDKTIKIKKDELTIGRL